MAYCRRFGRTFGGFMLKHVTIRTVLASQALLASAALAMAAELPPIKVADANAVLECATPGRLMAYLKSNNSKMQEQFEGIATEYMRHGEPLGIRWDYAFFQMLVETGYLKFTGDVDVKQNNFAGLGATGKGAKGESFPDVSTGVKAHLQHIVMYTGTPVDEPVAQRTRDVQAWGVLTKWQQSIKRPMTFKDLTSKWAPTSRAYPRDIVSVAERFEKGPCKADDPQPELVAEARGGQATTTAAAKSKPAAEAKSLPTPEEDAPPVAVTTDAGNAAKAPAAASPDAGVKVLNQPPPVEAAELGSAQSITPETKKADTKKKPEFAAATTSGPAKPQADAAKPGKPAEKAMETAAVSPPATAPAANAAKCKVWQASYGGSKAIIIKATADKMTNYTVLDVNDGSEKREADAYIAAYAKGGATVGEFNSSSQALEKAFQLCPEG